MNLEYKIQILQQAFPPFLHFVFKPLDDKPLGDKSLKLPHHHLGAKPSGDKSSSLGDKSLGDKSSKLPHHHWLPCDLQVGNGVVGDNFNSS